MTSDASSDGRLLRQDTLDAIRRAARRAGLTVEEWLRSAIIDTAADRGPRAARDSAIPGIRPRVEGASSQPRKREEEEGTAVEACRTGNRMRSSLCGIRSRLTALARDLAQHDHATRQQLAEGIRTINGRIDQLLAVAPSILAQQKPNQDAPALRQTPAQRRSMYDPQASLAGLEARLDAVMRELVPQNQAASQRLTKLVGELNDQLADLNSRLETRSGPGPAAAHSSMTFAAGAAQASLDRVEARIGSKASEIVPQQQMTTQRLAEVVSELNERLALLNSRVGNGVSEKSNVAPDGDRGDGSGPFGSGDDGPIEIGSARREISAGQQQIAMPSRLDDQCGLERRLLSGLERRLGHITDQIKALRVPSSADQDLFRRLGDHIGELARRLDSSGAQLQSLDAIEKKIEDLMLELKAARAAKTETEAELAASQTRGQAKIEALAQELGSFRERQIQIDCRTQEAMEAVHGTLERLLDRLANIELDLRVEQRVRQPSPSSTTAGESGVSVRAQPETGLGQGSSPQPTDAGVRPDSPLQPGSGAAAARRFSLQWPAASDVALGSGMAAEPPSKASFIAAARRAAQAAAEVGDEASARRLPVDQPRAADPARVESVRWPGICLSGSSC